MSLVKSELDYCVRCVIYYLKTVLIKKIYHNFQSYSDKKFHVVNVNAIIFTLEKEDSDAYYFVTIVKVCSEQWIQVKWHWEGFIEGSISAINVNRIQRDSARKRRILNYRNENVFLNLESLGAPG